MNTEKIAKLAVEMLSELRKEEPTPENELLLRMSEQRLKTLLVYFSSRKLAFDHDSERDEAISRIY